VPAVSITVKKKFCKIFGVVFWSWHLDPDHAHSRNFLSQNRFGFYKSIVVSNSQGTGLFLRLKTKLCLFR
jgi:hypothetical protein